MENNPKIIPFTPSYLELCVIRLQSELGLHCLPIPICPNVSNFLRVTEQNSSLIKERKLGTLFSYYGMVLVYRGNNLVSISLQRCSVASMYTMKCFCQI